MKTEARVAPPAALRALLTGAIDYAGLFPPCSLAVEPALHNHAEYVRSPDAWMLGAFVLPVTKFEDAAPCLVQFDPQHRLRISALGAKSENDATFLPAVETAKHAIVAFNTTHGPIALVDQLEMALPVKIDSALLERVGETLTEVGLPTFWEAPADEAERVIAFVAEHNERSGRTFGFKLRTGGVVASAFPSAIQIARALIAAVKHAVPIKFTAGLHHPVRLFHASVQGKMHGFLNVLGAGVLVAEHGWSLQQTATMLEDEDASAFSFADDRFTWREFSVSAERIRAHRRLITSLGSCSFDEPREDLRALQLL